MGCSEDLRYLLRLLPSYHRIGGERYVLFRMSRVVHGEGWVRMLFCRQCLHLYVPVVNSRMRYEEGKLEIECCGCGEKSVFDVSRASEAVGRSGEEAEAESFGYYFGE